MIKFVESVVVFSEIPDEITLSVNISNCQHNCVGCHSPYLRENVGKELTFEEVDKLIKENDGITCFCFMGEGNDKKALQECILYIRKEYPKIKIGLYSGSKDVDDFYWDNINYIKLGGYKEEFGPLNKKTTNQRLYYGGKYFSWYCVVNDVIRKGWKDITYKFWEKDYE